MKSTLFWQLRANYSQKKCPTPQPVTLNQKFFFSSNQEFFFRLIQNFFSSNPEMLAVDSYSGQWQIQEFPKGTSGSRGVRGPGPPRPQIWRPQCKIQEQTNEF